MLAAQHIRASSTTAKKGDARTSLARWWVCGAEFVGQYQGIDGRSALATGCIKIHVSAQSPGQSYLYHPASMRADVADRVAVHDYGAGEPAARSLIRSPARRSRHPRKREPGL